MASPEAARDESHDDDEPKDGIVLALSRHGLAQHRSRAGRLTRRDVDRESADRQTSRDAE